MVTEKDLKEGMDYCRIGEPTPEKMVRLAAYMIVNDHLFGEVEPPHTYSAAPAPQEQTKPIDTRGNTDFLVAVKGKPVEPVMAIMDELVETVKTLHPRMYESVMRKIREL